MIVLIFSFPFALLSECGRPSIITVIFPLLMLKNGKEIFEVDNYLKGVLKDLKTGKEEEIKSIE